MSGITWTNVEIMCKSSEGKVTVRALFRRHFEAAVPNCFRTALFLLQECLSCLHNRSIATVSVLLDELNGFTKEKSLHASSYLSLAEKMEVVNLAVELKNTAITDKLCRTFALVDEKMTFVSVVDRLLAEKKFVEACSLVVSLQLQSHYTLEDIVIPLIFQDRTSLAESYVRPFADLQVELVKYLDSLSIGMEHCERIVRKLCLSEVRRDKLRPKAMGKLVARLIKLFNISPEICPNLSNVRSVGAIKYLISRKYVQNNITEESWDELVKSAVATNESLAHELVTELICANEPREALRWALFYGLPRDSWSETLNNLPIDDNLVKTEEQTRDNEDVDFCWDEEIPRSYLPFPLDFRDIHLVDNLQQFLSCMDFISKGYDLVGLDGEWKPTFGLSTSKISLLQLAVWDAVYLLDMLALVKCLEPQHWDILVTDILANPSLVKLGYGFTSDLDMLAKVMPSGREKLKRIKRIVDLSTFCDKMRILRPDLVAPVTDSKYVADCKGLSQLANSLLGQPLDKTEQFSDWERRPLRPSQVIYAAMDAYCLLQIYDYLYNKALTLNLEFDGLLLEQVPKNDTKKKKALSILHNDEQKAGTSKIEFPGLEACDFRVVVDTMLQGLGRHLRLCGVDTVILENQADHDECAKIAQKENRFILTSGAPYEMLKGHMPDGMCLNVPCGMTASEQAELVFARYRVRVRQTNIFSRCPVCNGGKYEVFASGVLKDMHVAGRGTTSTGVPIGLNVISDDVFERVEAFNICATCGKVFWEGSHHSRVLRKLGNILTT